MLHEIPGSRAGSISLKVLILNPKPSANTYHANPSATDLVRCGKHVKVCSVTPGAWELASFTERY